MNREDFLLLLTAVEGLTNLTNFLLQRLKLSEIPNEAHHDLLTIVMSLTELHKRYGAGSVPDKTKYN